MHNLIKQITVGVLGALASLSIAQTASTFYRPQSGVEHTTKGKRAFHTNYLVLTGAWNHHHTEEVPAPLLAFHGPLQSSIQGYTPAEIRSAYGIPANTGTSAIAVIDAYDLPTNLSDFNTFSREFGLPVETSSTTTSSSNKVFQVVYPTGTKPAANSSWGGEIAIDMEWAHAIAPNAKIYLVECASDAVSDLFAGVQYVNQVLPNVGIVSMSFGGDEDSTELSDDSLFTSPNVTYLAASGDAPNTVSYPATSPNVVSVGGTSLNLSGSTVESEVYWYSDKNDGGAAGPSLFEPRPNYQSSLQSIVGNFRGTNDISANADPNTGCAIYVSTPVPITATQNASGWLVFGGTSLATPICAGILDSRGYLQPTSFQEISQLYGFGGSSFYRDITQGSNGTQSAAVGYDLVTGYGAPVGVFVNHPFTVTAANIGYGLRYSGVASNVVAKDGHDFEVKSIPQGPSQFGSIKATFSGVALGGTAVGGTVSVTGFCGASTTAIYAQNLSTGNYDFIGNISLGLTNSTATLSLWNLANYVNTSGKINLEVAGTSSSSFILGVDQITFTGGTI